MAAVGRGHYLGDIRIDIIDAFFRRPVAEPRNMYKIITYVKVSFPLKIFKHRPLETQIKTKV